jgi:hypothetical protein
VEDRCDPTAGWIPKKPDLNAMIEKQRNQFLNRSSIALQAPAFKQPLSRG